MSAKKKTPEKKLSVKNVKPLKSKTTKLSTPKKIDFSLIEKEAIARSDRTISTIENFLARWDAVKQKPETLKEEIVRVKRFYDSLIGWQKSTLKAQKSKFDEAAAKKRLASFVHICQNYS